MKHGSMNNNIYVCDKFFFLIVIITGQIERTPKKDDILPDLLQELTTKMSFTPNTHRTIQLNPHTSSSVPVKSDGNGFLGLFATLSNDPAAAISSATKAPLYLGNIDMEELKKFHDFQEVQDSNSQIAQYLKLKNLLTATKQNLENKKKSSRKTIMNKLLQNRRLDVDDSEDQVNPLQMLVQYGDDSEDKINALQMLVKSNIKDSLQNQHQYLSGTKSDLSKSHMAYAIPSAGNLNIYNSQVEKPGPPVAAGQLQNLPFLLTDPSPYHHQHSQSIMINPGANVDITSMQSNTPNPVNNDIHSTLPFLDVQPQKNLYSTSHKNHPLVLANYNNNNYQMKGSVQSIPINNPEHVHMKQNPVSTGFQYPKNTLNSQNMYGTSFVTPISHIQHNLAPKLNNYPVSSSDSGSTSFSSGQGFYNFVTQKPQMNSAYSNTLKRAQEEQRQLEAQLAQLKQVEQNLKQNKYGVGSSPINPAIQNENIRSQFPKSLSGFPMNFEDMLSTGLKLAEQSNKNSLQNQNLAELIHPRNSNNSPQTSWGSVPISPSNVNTASMSQDLYPNQIHSTDDFNFNPSQRIPQENLMQSNIVQSKMSENSLETNKIESNSIKSDKIHIIGPNCYLMSNTGFKLVGKAPNCIPTDTKDNHKFKSLLKKQRNHGRSGSIWDSISSIPLVNKFTRTLGIK